MNNRFFALRKALLVSCAVAAFCSGGALEVRAEEKRTYSIEQQDLAAALRKYTLTSGRDLIFSPELVRGRVNRSVNGDFLDEDVLHALLSGTGLDFARTPSGVLVLRQAPSKISAQVINDPGSFVVAQVTTTPQQQLPQTAAAPVEEIVVTGTRVQRDGYQAPTPLTVMGAAELNAAVPSKYLIRLEIPPDRG